MLDKTKIKESLTEYDIDLILKDLGSQPSKPDSKGHTVFTTVCHGGSKYKLYYDPIMFSFHCFSGCSATFNIFDLVINAKKVKGETLSFYDSMNYVANITGKWLTSDSNYKPEADFVDNSWLEKMDNKFKSKKTNQSVQLPEFSKNVLKAFLPLPHELWINDGISMETMDKFEVSYHIRTDKIIIPHYDIDHRLIGIRGRALLEEDLERGNKYMPMVVNGVDHRHNLSFNWYGINHNQNTIRKTKKAIIFEAEKSVLLCEDIFLDDNNSLASCGSSVSIYQRDMLIHLGVTDLIIAFDKEFVDWNSEEAEIYEAKIAKIAYMFTPYMNVFVVWDEEENLLSYKDSPVDKGASVFLKLLHDYTFRIKNSDENIGKVITKIKYC